MKRKIYLFTNTFPYGKNSEVFLESEIELVVKESLADICIIPLHKKDYCRILPKQVKLCNKLANVSLLKKIQAALNMLFSKWFWILPFSVDHPRSIKEVYCALKYLYGALLVKNFILREKSYFEDEGIFYSYWFNHTPLGLYWAKNTDSKFRNYPIYTRAHGFDVYERKVGVYFPYRNETLQNITAVFVVSQTGCSYLQEHYVNYKNKIQVSHLGVFPILESYIDKEKNSDLSFVSCSSVIPIKRVECIFETLNKFCHENPTMKVTWTHIGGGKGLVNLSQLTQCCADNLTVSLQGLINNTLIRELYKNKHFDLFLNLSISEGIPVSIMEAISAGIPVIATNVGGNHEIVVSKTGKLVPVDFTFNQFVEAVDYICKNITQYRVTTLDFYTREFSAFKNYIEFYNDLMKY